MKKLLNSIIFILTCINLSVVAAAETAENANYNDYEADYYEEEGKLLFKIRGYGIAAKAKQEKLPAPLSPTPKTVSPLIKNGFGGDTATAIFLNEYIAAEMSLGFNMFRTKYAALRSISNNYLGATLTSKKSYIYMVPLSLTGQFHLAPYGGIRPYVGAGYHGAYMYTRAKEFKIRNGHGAVMQAGVDLVAKDDTLINVDIRQFFLTTRVKYTPRLLGNKSFSSKIKINPLVVAIGVGFKF